MKFQFWKQRPSPPEASADDMLKLAELSDGLTLAADILRAHQSALAEAMMSFAPGVVAAFDEWAAKVAEWDAVAARLNLSERRVVVEVMNQLRPTVEMYRNLLEQSANVAWPDEIEATEGI